MKKKKIIKQSPANFQNTPFKSLKKVVAAAPAREEKKTEPVPASRRHAPSQEDEASLFMRAVEGVKKIAHTTDVPSSPARQRATKKADNNAEKDEQLFLQAMKKIGTAFRDHAGESEAEEEGRRSPTSRIRQLKRGAIRISQELDLHGYLKNEAITRLERFISGAFSRGQTAVLVITGKGLNSPEGPVLRGAVAEWLQQKGKGMVAEFSPAPANLGGSGAFVVFLKKK